MNNVMTQGIIRGDAPEKMISAITDRFDVDRNKAARSVSTDRHVCSRTLSPPQDLRRGAPQTAA